MSVQKPGNIRRFEYILSFCVFLIFLKIRAKEKNTAIKINSYINENITDEKIPLSQLIVVAARAELKYITNISKKVDIDQNFLNFFFLFTDECFHDRHLCDASISLELILQI